jgi:glycerophosphoryl diester phosphodiesterase
MVSPPSPFGRLRAAAATAGTVVVAHRGDSHHHPENTLAAFRAAAAAGVVMQEFDVHQCRDGELVCLHDASLDRTTDAAARLGPGALVSQLTLRELATLDAGSWRGAAHRSARIPTLAEALAVIQPHGIPLVEHKSGAASSFVDLLRRTNSLHDCILQSFDWQFLAAARAAAPSLALALLGPAAPAARPDAAAIAMAHQLGAGMLHWQATALTRADVQRIQAAGLLVCAYTADDELSWAGARAMGIDAMCTNDPLARIRVE